uniref:Uncharacterized protein n=1 Tax=Ascaris lumbricoides TaxID=6252 RepID=A0A0M3HH21_ASCLU
MMTAYLSSQLAHRYYSFKDIFEDNVYTPSNISVLDGKYFHFFFISVFFFLNYWM